MDSTPLSDLQRAKAIILQLKIENLQLRTALADRETRLAVADLNQERDALAVDFINTCGGDAKAGDTWNWSSMNLNPKAPVPNPTEPTDAK